MKTKRCPKCEQEKPHSEFHTKGKENRLNSWCKVCVYDSQKLRWKNRRMKAVQLLGGKCCKCGYNKNICCLDFHHLDPSKKDMDWNRMKGRKWERVVEELKKCVLVCRNCHGEIHWPNQFLEVDGSGANNLLNSEQKIFAPTGECPLCGVDVYGTKYCSVDCVSKDHRKIERHAKEELLHLIETMPWTQIGKKYGVSDNAVRKWAKVYGIVGKGHKVGYWTKVKTGKLPVPTSSVAISEGSLF